MTDLDHGNGHEATASPYVVLTSTPGVVTTATLTYQTEVHTQLVDITDDIRGILQAVSVQEGLVHVFSLHTTCGLTLNEHEDGFHEDLISVLDEVAPRTRYWAHDDLSRRTQNLMENERANGHSHTRACLATTSHSTLPVVGGDLFLGRWQRLFLVELDGPRERQVLLQIWGARQALASDAVNSRQDATSNRTFSVGADERRS